MSADGLCTGPLPDLHKNPHSTAKQSHIKADKLNSVQKTCTWIVVLVGSDVTATVHNGLECYSILNPNRLESI